MSPIVGPAVAAAVSLAMFLTLAALAGILAAAGHLIAVAFRPRAIRA